MKKRFFTATLVCMLLFLLSGCQTNAEPVSTPSPSATPEADSDQTLDTYIAAMPLEDKVSQLFFVRCPDVDAVAVLENHQFGGYLLFGRDFEDQTPDSIRAVISQYQSVSKIPILVGVDEEGGEVCRVSQYPAFRPAPFPSPQTLLNNGGLEAVAADTAEKSDFLKALGINVNLAPVCDLSTSPSDYIYDRTTGRGADETADYIQTVVSVMHDHGIGSVLKHFPGYGPNTDTHQDFSRDTRSLETLEANDFLPFIAGTTAGADAILVNHNITDCLDSTLPASLSAPVHQYLRESLHFDGVIMTDDLDMAAIRDYFPADTAAVAAVAAGNDLIITSDYELDIPAVITAVQNGQISEEQIDTSVKRILKWKVSLHLLEA